MVDILDEKTPDKPRTLVTELTQLGAQDVEIELEYPDEIKVIPARTLTFSEWNQCDRDEPPVPRHEVGGGLHGPVYDDRHPAYLKALDERRERVLYRQVLKALRLPIPGDTLDARMTYLKDTLGVPAMTAIISGISQAHTRVRAQVNNRADTFLANGHGSHADNGEAG